MAHEDEQSAWTKLFGSIASWYDQLLDRIAVSIESAFNGITNSLSGIIDKLSGILEQVATRLTAAVDNIYTKIAEFVKTTVEQVTLFVDDLLSEIVSGMRDLIGNADNYIRDLTISIVDFFERLMDQASSNLGDIFDVIYKNIVDIVDRVSTLFADIYDAVITQLESIADNVKLFIGDLFDTVKQGVEQIIGQGQRVVSEIVDSVKLFINSVVDVVGNSLRELLDTISNLPAEISELARRLIESAEDNIKLPLTALPTSLITYIVDSFGGDLADDVTKMFDGMQQILFGSSPVTRSPETMRDIIASMTPAHPMAKFVMTMITSLFVIPMVYSGIASANSQIILQEHALENPYRLIEPDVINRAWYRDLLPTNLATEELRKHGYTESAAEIMLASAETVPPEREQLNWWLRGFIGADELDKSLKAAGWGAANINLLKDAAWVLPPVQDLITMAVREVFTPNIAAKFGQFDDYPPQFTAHAAKIGLNKTWALNYWAAHWRLPSVTMGFEMLHRRVINKDELDMLLRSADVMPFWRDKLIEISYSPLTRVDIRRMHKLGVLTEMQVMTAYMDIGYDTTNAKRLLDFTIKLNAPAEAQNDADLSSLSTSNIVNFYSDGVITKDDANKLLIDSGMSKGAARLYLDNAEMANERSERKKEIELILDRTDSGVITYEQAQDDLNRIGLETAEIQKAIAELNKREARRTKLPSRSDLDKMYKASIIRSDEYLDTLNRLGYSNYWSDKYLKLLQG